jgi:hypothetical protein
MLFAFGACNHIANTGNWFTNILRFVGCRDDFAAVISGIAEADDAFAVFSKT